MKRKNIIILLAIAVCIALNGCQNAGKQEKTEGNGLPVLSIMIEPAEFAKVNESEDHSYRAKGGSISITVPADYKGDYSDEILNDSGELELDYIRGRGHGTWSADKKPYKFKLKDSYDLLGMGKDKNWVLLANRYDETLLRNRLGSYISERMGLAYTMKCLPVDLQINGEYRGSYLLSQEVEIDKTRVNIASLSEEDNQEPDLSGGYLICTWPQDDEPLQNLYYSDRVIIFGNEEPQFTEDEDGTPQQKAYIDAYIQKTEDAIFGENFCDENGVSYQEYMDITSAADYWWIQEYIKNYDGFSTSSTYLYKERAGKLYWGPLWDVDLSMGGGFDGAEGFNNCRMPWLDHLRDHDPEYQQLLKERWKALDAILDEILQDGGVLDQYTQEIENSWQADHERWPLIDEEGQEIEVSFQDSISSLKTWMRERQKWINDNIDTELTYVYNTVTFMADGNIVTTADCQRDRVLNQYPNAPKKDGYVFIGWEDENL